MIGFVADHTLVIAGTLTFIVWAAALAAIFLPERRRR